MTYQKAQAALVHDAVTLMADTFNRMLKKKPDTFRSYVRGGKGDSPQGVNASRTLNCSRNAVWEQGDRIAKNARKVFSSSSNETSFFLSVINFCFSFSFIQPKQSDLEGLTGILRFGEDGRRENFTLGVVEMTVNSDIVKVFDN